MSDPERIPPDFDTQPTQPILAPDVHPTWHVDQRRTQRRGPIYLAAVLVCVLGGGGLFFSGFTLGRLAGATPGTSESRQELFRPFWDAFNDISLNYVGQVDEKKLVEGAIKGVFSALEDPYSAYMTEEEYRASLTGLSGEFEGIGAELSTLDTAGEACATISLTCRLTVVRVIRGSPALDAGLQADDVILAVDGKPTLDSSLELIIPTIRGPKGSTVTLSLERAGQPLEMAIVRDVIISEDVRSEVLSDGRVGYLKIVNFSSGAATDLHDQLRVLVQEQGIRSIILDLRDDPGGYVDAARRIASEFVSQAPLYWEQEAGEAPVQAEIVAGGVATDATIGVIVLVNGGTASASEIVAGSIQGSGRGRLVGEQTFGKGTIQEWKELPGAGGYRLSVRKWLTPDQTWIHGVGLAPDVVVEAPAEPEPGIDVVLDRAVELLTDGTALPSPRPAASPAPDVGPTPTVVPSGVLLPAAA